jgi:hypothetical protein
MGWWLDLDVVRDTMALNFYFWNYFLFNSGIFSFILLGIHTSDTATYVQKRYLCKGTFKLQCQQVFGPYKN